MNRKIRLLLVATIPIFVFVNVYQTYSYQKIDSQVTLLEARQQTWLEENKKTIAGIAVLTAPQRIEQIARDKLGMKRHDLDPVLRIRLSGSKNGNDG